MLKQLRAWINTWPLFLVIAFWVTVGLGALTGLFGLWAYNSATPNSPTGSPQAIKKACFDAAEGFVANLQCVWKTAGAGPDTYEAMKLALAVIGGIGGVAFLVIKYRTRVSEEHEEARADRKEAEAKLVAAVEQLGSEFPQVRIAGVYALADLADTYLGDYKQRVVNILCGYLRTKRGEFIKREEVDKQIQDGNRLNIGTDLPLMYVSDDAPVESTVLEVLAAHLRKEDALPTLSRVKPELSWSECKVDLHGANFTEPLVFNSTAVENDISFKSCHFAREINFDDSTFNGVVSFDDSTFNGRASFVGSTFNIWASFEGSTFNANASFEDSTSKYWASFERCNFNSGVSFDGTKFNARARFARSNSDERACFDRSTFNGWARFSGCRFDGPISFDGSTFNDSAYFDQTEFNGGASFDGSTFNDGASFDGSTFNT
ncbi:pentapeptide repeat-containing protein [Buchananella felis]|uniref:pentapeptide repeat-containing protein n=1 Tax=Buchananella felis TaxID=3231492 RepID=UPI003528854F